MDELRGNQRYNMFSASLQKQRFAMVST